MRCSSVTLYLTDKHNPGFLKEKCVKLSFRQILLTSNRHRADTAIAVEHNCVVLQRLGRQAVPQRIYTAKDKQIMEAL